MKTIIKHVGGFGLSHPGDPGHDRRHAKHGQQACIAQVCHDVSPTPWK
jgi:hypothetical protein